MWYVLKMWPCGIDCFLWSNKRIGRWCDTSVEIVESGRSDECNRAADPTGATSGTVATVANAATSEITATTTIEVNRATVSRGVRFAWLQWFYHANFDLLSRCLFFKALSLLLCEFVRSSQKLRDVWSWMKSPSQMFLCFISKDFWPSDHIFFERPQLEIRSVFELYLTQWAQFRVFRSRRLTRLIEER